MDVDNDIDSQLLQQFSSLGTQDKDVLIAEFQKLLGNQLNPACCAFFLDMNNWNLQDAICSYYDYEQPNMLVPRMAFLKDETVGEGESVPPNTRFTKTWRIQNTGDDTWPPGCSLKFMAGEPFGLRDRVCVDALKPGEIAAINLIMTSPPSTGIYQSQWRMNTATGLIFGDVIWVILAVEEHGLLGVTQQMSQCGGNLGGPLSQSVPLDNPFGSPQRTPNTSFGSPHSYPGSPFGVGGSPSLSVVGQAGSLPCSPSTMNSSFSTSPPSHVRTALFQNPDDPLDEVKAGSIQDSSMDSS